MRGRFAIVLVFIPLALTALLAVSMNGPAAATEGGISIDGDFTQGGLIVVTVPALTCSFDQYGSYPYRGVSSGPATSCMHMDSAGGLASSCANPSHSCSPPQSPLAATDPPDCLRMSDEVVIQVLMDGKHLNGVAESLRFYDGDYSFTLPPDVTPGEHTFDVYSYSLCSSTQTESSQSLSVVRTVAGVDYDPPGAEEPPVIRDTLPATGFPLGTMSVGAAGLVASAVAAEAGLWRRRRR